MRRVETVILAALWYCCGKAWAAAAGNRQELLKSMIRAMLITVLMLLTPRALAVEAGDNPEGNPAPDPNSAIAPPRRAGHPPEQATNPGPVNGTEDAAAPQPAQPDTADLIARAEEHLKLLQFAEAEQLYLAAIAWREVDLGPAHPSVAYALNGLAVVYTTGGRPRLAEPLYQRALAIAEQAFGPEHATTAVYVNNLANHYRSVSDYSRAAPLAERALELTGRFRGPSHPDVATCQNNLAMIYHRQERYADSERLYLKAVAAHEKNPDADDPGLCFSLNNLGELYRDLRRYNEAESLFQRSITLRVAAFGPMHPSSPLQKPIFLEAFQAAMVTIFCVALSHTAVHRRRSV